MLGNPSLFHELNLSWSDLAYLKLSLFRLEGYLCERA
jgi:hypothetical protein